MSYLMKRDNERTPKYLKSLKCVLHTYQPKSVHYVGYAHEEILRLLISVIKIDYVSIMDYWNRYGIETEFDYDTGERVHESLLPKEFEKVNFYIEGGAESELLIWDMPWHYKSQLEKILKFRHPVPNYILLANEAMQVKLPLNYFWQNLDFCLLGNKTV